MRRVAKTYGADCIPYQQLDRNILNRPKKNLQVPWVRSRQASFMLDVPAKDTNNARTAGPFKEAGQSHWAGGRVEKKKYCLYSSFMAGVLIQRGRYYVN